jgi:hypothetical protein
LDKAFFVVNETAQVFVNFGLKAVRFKNSASVLLKEEKNESADNVFGWKGLFWHWET